MRAIFVMKEEQLQFNRMILGEVRWWLNPLMNCAIYWKEEISSTLSQPLIFSGRGEVKMEKSY